MLQFTCPKCSNTVLEEVMIDVIQTSIITAIDEDGSVDYDFNRVSSDGGEVESYQCFECGYVVENEDSDYPIRGNEELVKWLKENCSQKETTND